jgi:hypothetical protein
MDDRAANTDPLAIVLERRLRGKWDKRASGNLMGSVI